MGKQHLSRDDRIFMRGKLQGTRENMDMVAMVLMDKCGWHVQEETSDSRDTQSIAYLYECLEKLAEDEVLLLEIGGALYYIADIGLRMLSPRELYNAMGFPPDYIIDRDYLGNEYKKSAQVARCGNAVCPPVASALVRANLPEWCGVTITTMAQLMDCVAV